MIQQMLFETMPPRPTVVLLRSDNRIVVEPTTNRIASLLKPQLTFSLKEWLQGREATLAEKAGRPPVVETPIECFFLDHRGRIATTHGFIQRITDVLTAAGFSVCQKWADPVEELAIAARKHVFEPNWDVLYNYLDLLNRDLRPKQDDFLVKLGVYDSGRVDCPPAWGKTFIIECAALAYHRATFLITSRRVNLLVKEIYPALCRSLSDVGCVGGGKHSNLAARVMCCTAQSLQHVSHLQYDYVLFDECHEAPTDDCAYKLGLLSGRPRMWGFSGTMDMRLDNRDLIVESIFGPVRLKVTRQEAQEQGLVAPIKVKVRNVNMNVNPCMGCRRVDKKRLAFWTNDFRNQLIAEDARQYPATQVLIVVETIEHLVNIKRFLPEMVMMHAESGMSDKDRARYVRLGFIDETEPEMTWQRVDKIYNAIRSGRPGIYGALEPMVGVGFNAPQLKVLIRADGAGSPTRDRQLPGRSGRIHEDKVEGIVHDYMDNFDKGTQLLSKRRLASYKAEGFQIVMLDRANKLSALLGD